MSLRPINVSEEITSAPISEPPTPSIPITPTAPMPPSGALDFLGYNTIRRVNRTGGLVGAFRTKQRNVMDQVDDLNRSGYRATFITPDSWTFIQWLGAAFLLICTLGIYSKAPGLLIIGERIQW